MPVVPGGGYELKVEDVLADVRALVMQSDENDSWWDDDDHLIPYLNLTLRKMANAGLPTLAWEFLETVAGEQTTTPSASVFKIASVYLEDGGAYQRLPELSEVDLNRETGGDWAGSAGVPSGWFWDGSSMVWNAVPSVIHNVKVWYWSVPVGYVAGSEEIGYGVAFAPLIAEGIVCYAQLGTENLASYKRWKGEWEEDLISAIGRFEKGQEGADISVKDTIGW